MEKTHISMVIWHATKKHAKVLPAHPIQVGFDMLQIQFLALRPGLLQAGVALGSITSHCSAKELSLLERAAEIKPRVAHHDNTQRIIFHHTP